MTSTALVANRNTPNPRRYRMSSEPIPMPTRRRITRHWDARQLMLARRATVALLLLILFFIFHPVYVYVRDHRDFETCQDNVQKIWRGISTYADDYDGTL